MRWRSTVDTGMRAASWGVGPLDERVRRSAVVETPEPSDEDLCRRTAQQDGGAFDLLVERYQERAYRIAWSVVRDREDARDCSQEAFIRLHESAGSFAGQAKFSTWFYRILVNCCLDHQRKRRSWRRLVGWGGRRDDERDAGDPVERLAAPFTDPTDAIATGRRMSQLWEAVEDLSPQQRAAVLLQCREELSTKEIAVVLQLSEATVRVHLHRAYTTLRRRVGDASGGNASRGDKA
jgi:RNA polymerase sigma-70 factor (ECF subfamily)